VLRRFSNKAHFPSATMGNAAMDCAGTGRLADVSEGMKTNQNGKFLVEIAASVLFGVPPFANAYHTSIVVAGEEYFFSDQGMCFDDKLISHQGSPSEKYEAGRTDYSGTEMWWALQEHFRPGTYDLLRKNCNSFSDVALFFLLRKRLDKRYSSLETLGRTSPELVKRVIYIPNPVADEFDPEAVIAAVSKLGAGKKALQRLADMRFDVPAQDHRIPHLPRPSIATNSTDFQRPNALDDITNAASGPGARANEVEAAMLKTHSRVREDFSGSTTSTRPAPRKFASSQASRRSATPPRQPLATSSTDTNSAEVPQSCQAILTSMPRSDAQPLQSASNRPKASPRGMTTPRQSVDRFLTNRVYPTNRKAPGSDKENLTPRGDETRRSRSKGPITRSGASFKSFMRGESKAAIGGA